VVRVWAARRWREQRRRNRWLAVAVLRLLLVVAARSAAVEAGKQLRQVGHGEGESGDLAVC
jgi:hypothetical protein